jgi:hypothetical protein
MPPCVPAGCSALCEHGCGGTLVAALCGCMASMGRSRRSLCYRACFLAFLPAVVLCESTAAVGRCRRSLYSDVRHVRQEVALSGRIMTRRWSWCSSLSMFALFSPGLLSSFLPAVVLWESTAAVGRSMAGLALSAAVPC